VLRLIRRIKAYLTLKPLNDPAKDSLEFKREFKYEQHSPLRRDRAGQALCRIQGKLHVGSQEEVSAVCRCEVS
jgi:hypothetical protein